MEKEIIKLLEEKGGVKQEIYRLTQSVFINFQKILKEKSERISKEISVKDKSINIDYSSKGKFEAQIKFSGETLLFHMHSNIFDFPKTHSMHKSEYVKKDPLSKRYNLVNQENNSYLNHPLTNVQGTAGQFAEFSSIIYRAILR